VTFWLIEFMMQNVCFFLLVFPLYRCPADSLSSLVFFQRGYARDGDCRNYAPVLLFLDRLVLEGTSRRRA